MMPAEKTGRESLIAYKERGSDPEENRTSSDSVLDPINYGDSVTARRASKSQGAIISFAASDRHRPPGATKRFRRG